jgi:hypothetical protein
MALTFRKGGVEEYLRVLVASKFKAPGVRDRSLAGEVAGLASRNSCKSEVAGPESRTLLCDYSMGVELVQKVGSSLPFLKRTGCFIRLQLSRLRLRLWPNFHAAHYSIPSSM